MKRSGEQGSNSRKRGEMEEDGMDMEEEAGGLVFEDPFGDDFEEEEIVEGGDSDEEDDCMDEEVQEEGAEKAAPR